MSNTAGLPRNPNLKSKNKKSIKKLKKPGESKFLKSLVGYEIKAMRFVFKTSALIYHSKASKYVSSVSYGMTKGAMQCEIVK